MTWFEFEEIYDILISFLRKKLISGDDIRQEIISIIPKEEIFNNGFFTKEQVHEALNNGDYFLNSLDWSTAAEAVWEKIRSLEDRNDNLFYIMFNKLGHSDVVTILKQAIRLYINTSD